MTLQLEGILRELGISQYLPALVAQGFDAWETLLDITEADLETLDVKLGHRRKLQRRIASYRGVAPGAPLALSSSHIIEDDARRPDPVISSVAPVDGIESKDPPVATKRKYRRHPKPDENAPERPPSAYVLFSNRVRELLKGQELSFSEVAKLVGEKWQALQPSEKEVYETQAHCAKERYSRDLAEYKKTESYAKYGQYLQDFKAKQALHAQDKEVTKRLKLSDSAKRPSLGSSASSASIVVASPGKGSSHIEQQRFTGPTSAPRPSSSDTHILQARNRLADDSDTATTVKSPLSFASQDGTPDRSPAFSLGGSRQALEVAAAAPSASSSTPSLRPSPPRWGDEAPVGKPPTADTRTTKRDTPPLPPLSSLLDAAAGSPPPDTKLGRRPVDSVLGWVDNVGLPSRRPPPNPIVSSTLGPTCGTNSSNSVNSVSSSASNVTSNSANSIGATCSASFLSLTAVTAHSRPSQESALPIHALLSQSTKPLAHLEPDILAISSCLAAAKPSGAVLPPLHQEPQQRQSGRKGKPTPPATEGERQYGPPGTSLDGMSALLKAGELVNRGGG